MIDVAYAGAATLAFMWVACATVRGAARRRATNEPGIVLGRFAVLALLALLVIDGAHRAGEAPDSATGMALWLLWLPAAAGAAFESWMRLARLESSPEHERRHGALGSRVGASVPDSTRNIWT